MIHMRNLNQALNHGLVFNKSSLIHLIRSKCLAKICIDIHRANKKKARTDLDREFFKLMKYAVLEKL